MFRLVIISIIITIASFANAEDVFTYQGTTNFPGCIVNQENSQYFVEDESSINLQADDVSGYGKNYSLAKGDVSVTGRGRIFTSNWAMYDIQNSHFTAGDKVTLIQGPDIINAKWADYYFDLNKGSFTDAVASMNNGQLTATGDIIDVKDAKHYSANNGLVTSCQLNNPFWSLRANEVDFDYGTGEAVARDAKFYVESVPIFYSPYVSFSLGGRKSGFLLPDIGGNSNSGPMIGTPFYWNMAPNYDMTIEPTYYMNQGFVLSDQFRYMTESGAGTIYTEQLPSSISRDGMYRYYWHLDGTENIAPDLNVGYVYNRVSDNNYFWDLGGFYSYTDNINLQQSAFINYTPSYGKFNLMAQGFQTLQPDGLPPVSQIYATLPQLSFTLNPINYADFSVNLDTQYTYFYNPTLQSAQRYYAYPSVTYNLINQVYGYSKLKAGYDMAYYQIQSFPGYYFAGDTNRNVPIYSVDNGLYFDRSASFFGNSYTQTIEPRLYYLYIPEVNQGQIPLFDTAPATYNLSQLFSENRFIGIDRVNMANDITLGGTTRLINDANGNEIMNLGAGYRYYITPENMFLYGNYSQYSQLFMPTPDFITELNNTWSNSLRTNAYYQLDTISANTVAYGVGGSYSPEKGKVLNVKFNYQYNLPLLLYQWQPGQTYSPYSYENQYALDVSGQWPITSDKKWSLLGRSNYDFTQGRLLNLIAGVEYSIGCFSVRAVAETYVSNIINTTNAFFLQFDLKGLANLGNNPGSDIVSGIPGYSSSNFIH